MIQNPQRSSCVYEPSLRRPNHRGRRAQLTSVSTARKLHSKRPSDIVWAEGNNQSGCLAMNLSFSLEVLRELAASCLNEQLGHL